MWSTVRWSAKTDVVNEKRMWVIGSPLRWPSYVQLCVRCRTEVQRVVDVIIMKSWYRYRASGSRFPSRLYVSVGLLMRGVRQEIKGYRSVISIWALNLHKIIVEVGLWECGPCKVNLKANIQVLLTDVRSLYRRYQRSSKFTWAWVGLWTSDGVTWPTVILNFPLTSSTIASSLRDTSESPGCKIRWYLRDVKDCQIAKTSHSWIPNPVADETAQFMVL